MGGEGTPEDNLESLRLVWPAYFADPEAAPPTPPFRTCVAAYSGIIGEVTTGTDGVAAGHFPWIEAPGCVRDALARLAG